MSYYLIQGIQNNTGVGAACSGPFATAERAEQALIAALTGRFTIRASIADNAAVNAIMADPSASAATKAAIRQCTREQRDGARPASSPAPAEDLVAFLQSSGDELSEAVEGLDVPGGDEAPDWWRGAKAKIVAVIDALYTRADRI